MNVFIDSLTAEMKNLSCLLITPAIKYPQFNLYAFIAG